MLINDWKVVKKIQENVPLNTPEKLFSQKWYRLPKANVSFSVGGFKGYCWGL